MVQTDENAFMDFPSTMSLREMNLRVFQGKPLPHVFFQPRFEPWFELHKGRGSLPRILDNTDIHEAYRLLGVSMRYIHYMTGAPSPVEMRQITPVESYTQETGRGYVSVLKTPHGELVTHYGVTEQGCRILEFPVKTPDDLRNLEWYFRNTEYYFNQEGFKYGAALMGDLGEPQFFVPRSPYQALLLDWINYEDLVSLLYEEPETLEGVREAIDDAYNTLYEGITQCASVHIVNFGENVDGRLLSPSLFERFHLPFYEKRADQLHSAGIYITIHLDGSLRSLLPYLHALPVDGLEALTPIPQGDVTLEEIRDHIGDKILLDGIPALYFLEDYPEELLLASVERIVELFGHRLVLGISDELPMGAGPQAVERLIKVRDYCLARHASVS